MSVGSRFTRSLAHSGALLLLFGCGSGAPERTHANPPVEMVPAGGMSVVAAGAGGAGVPAGGRAAGGSSGNGAGQGAVATGAGGASAGAATTAGASALGGFAGSAAGVSAAGASAAGAAGTPPLDSRPAFDAAIAALADLDATSIVERYPTAFEPAPTYDATAITGLDALQASSLALSDAEQRALTQTGFVIAAGHSFPTFGYGYSSIYAEDLPVYISADSIVEGLHRSYDLMLERVEELSLASELTTLLDGMRAGLAAGTGAELGADVRADVDTYLAVAASLLEGTTLAPVAGGSATDIANFVNLATMATGLADVNLFGEVRASEDFSEFTPRGHYTDSTALEQYFRAVVWLGRIDVRLLETHPDGSQAFNRRELDDMLLVNALVTDELRAHFDTLDGAIRAFVGEPDYMQLSQVGSLLADVGVTSLTGAAAISDQTFEQAIVKGGYGVQRIASHIMVDGLASSGTLPPTLSFALLGQRYVIDSNVFSNLVYDRVGGGKIMRLMPNPLDVAFTVFQNNQAAALLAPELARYPYAPDLAAMRLLVDAHPSDFWQESLYNLWLGALGGLSPGAIANGATAAALPATFRSEQWGRRLLSTELASWAELRLDTVAYAKQSYTGASLCSFPDGYVDPYPEFYAKLLDFATMAKTTVLPLLQSSAFSAMEASTYFDDLTEVATRLRDMAEAELTGAAFTQDMLDFLNDAVYVDEGCGSPHVDGWYSKLFFSPGDGAVFDPTIADVHTQATDASGNLVGNVLHVGTGDARLLVVVADTCSGPHLYAGLASSYREVITSNFQRLDDPTWATMVRAEPDVPWMADIVTP